MILHSVPRFCVCWTDIAEHTVTNTLPFLSPVFCSYWYPPPTHTHTPHSPSRRMRWRWRCRPVCCSAPSVSRWFLSSGASRSTCATRWSTRMNLSPQGLPSPSSRSGHVTHPLCATWKRPKNNKQLAQWGLFLVHFHVLHAYMRTFCALIKRSRLIIRSYGISIY